MSYQRYGRRSSFYASIINEEGKILILISAIDKFSEASTDVFKIYFDGTHTQAKNIGFCSGGCGYLVGYDKQDIFYDDEWGDMVWKSLPRIYVTWNEEQRWLDYGWLMSYFKDCCYFIKKYENNCKGKNIFDFYELFKKWQEHKNEVEALTELGLDFVALDKRLWKLTNVNKRKLIKYIQDNIDVIKKYKATLSHIFIMEKNHCSFDIAAEMIRNKLNSIKDVFYFRNFDKDERKVSLWKDYLRTLDKLCINKNDPYWRYPKDIIKSHDEYVKLFNQREEEIKESEVSPIVKILKDKKETFNNFTLKFPTSFKEIREHAKILNQCLVSSGYDKKFLIEHKTALVFINTIDNKPIATAEISKENNIIQFYGDEHDRNNCTPPKQLKDLVKKYIKKYRWNALIGV